MNPNAASAGPADDILWVMGGNTNSGHSNDVWCSSDQGLNWVQVTANAPWSPRMNHKVVIFNNQLWLVGGNTGSSNVGDVWHTTGTATCAPNGLTWQEVTSSAPFGTRAAGTMIVYGGQLWYMGGRTVGVTSVNDVWSSVDGATWTQVTAAAPWEERDRMESIVYNDRLYVMGGRTGGEAGPYHNDVWSTVDGVNWVEETAAAPWAGRRDFALYEMDGRMYVSSGRQANPVRYNDIWSSNDGITWTQEADASWAERYHTKVTKREGVMYMVGGFGPGLHNDVWSSVDGLTWTQTVATIPWASRDHHQLIAFSTVPQPATLTSRVYIDTNNNGQYDVGETPVAGATVTITPSGGGPAIVLTTGPDGVYTTPIAPGSYEIEVSNIDPSYNIYEGEIGYVLSVAEGENVTFVSDFGLVITDAQTEAPVPTAPNAGSGDIKSSIATGYVMLVLLVLGVGVVRRNKNKARL